jgi:hypothetical protein
VRRAAPIRAVREASKQAGHAREPRVPVSRDTFALVDGRDRAFWGNEDGDDDAFGFIDATRRSIFGPNHAAERRVLVERLRRDEAIIAADSVLPNVPSRWDYNAHVMEAILIHAVPALGRRRVVACA